MGIEDFVSTENERLDSQLLFTAEIDRMTSVLRRTMLLDMSRRENDAEHSWHIAIMAMLFSEYAIRPVNVERAVQMCIVHDLVEIYAGDTFAYDVKGNTDKKSREQQAADRLYSMLPDDQGTLLRDYWEEFDAMKTDDAKYAACMDRIQPFFHNTLTDGHTWVEGDTCRAQVEERMSVVKEFMPGIYSWMEKCMDYAEEQGWLRG